MFDFLSVLDWFALVWFTCCWLGYAFFARSRAKFTPTLASSLTDVRGVWLYRLLTRDVRIADVTALGILQRNVAFFASTTIFILAGLLTVLGATDQAVELLNSLPFVVENTQAAWEVKLLVLIFTFVYSFFKFAWSVRQYNFAIIMFGAAPSSSATEQERENFVIYANKLLTTASNSFNYGLRGYSFAMAILAWFVQPWLFIITSTWVVGILFRREFHSRSLKALKAIGTDLPG